MCPLEDLRALTTGRYGASPVDSLYSIDVKAVTIKVEDPIAGGC